MDTEFIKIYDLLKNDILRLAFSYTKNISDAEDITQEVFIKLYENFSKFNNDFQYIKKWCIKVTINKCKNLFLSNWKKRISFITEKEENRLYQDIKSNSDTILNALLLLPKKYRIIVFLYYYDGFKINEIANILKIKEGTIKTRLKRSKDKLKKILKEEKF